MYHTRLHVPTFFLGRAWLGETRAEAIERLKRAQEALAELLT